MKLPPQVRKALERLNAAGYEAFAVGGCVRDALLGRTPNDWDVTTSARPEQTAACFLDCRRIETGLKHGTLTVILDGMTLEITTFRQDGDYADHRHPVEVTFSPCVEEDLARRDFTVNAMAYHPERGLVDLFGGREDLASRRIVCVGEPARRFDEDGLRILRAIRFASVLDFTVEENTSAALREGRGLLAHIAAERIREEFCKLICGVGAVRILEEYRDVVAQIIPELEACMGFDQHTRYHCYDVYGHTLRALSHSSADLRTRLAILLHDVGKPSCYTRDGDGGHFYGHAEKSAELTGEILRRLRFDRATEEAVTALVGAHHRPIPTDEKSVKRLMQRFSDEDIQRLVALWRCDRLGCAPEFSTPDPALDQVLPTVERLRSANACLSLRDLTVKGQDLMAMGIPAGKELGELLGFLLDRVVDGELPNDRDELLRAARNRWSSLKKQDGFDNRT
ncbi:MAG: CCA tRNA nucleotidyltransferase [Clostridia bacterium]|nr:CCA tRNA nucleotidyltransferase [Clostridia bacterium]